MTTRINPRLVYNQTSAGVDTSVLADPNGWFDIDIAYPTDCNRLLFVSKNTADTLAIVAKSEAKMKDAFNQITVVTIQATVASVASGVVTGVVTIASPYPALRIEKTGTAGLCQVIAVV